MSEEQNIHDLIDRYLRDELERDEMDRFRNRMRNEPDFAREVELQRAIVESVQATRKVELKKYLKEHAKVEYIGNIWGKTWMYASAAVLIVMVSLYFLIQNINTNSTDLADENKKDADKTEVASEEILRSPDPKSDTNFLSDSQMVVVEDGYDDVEANTQMNERRPPQISPVEDEAVSPGYANMAKDENALDAESIADSIIRADRMVGNSTYAVTVITVQKEIDQYLQQADSKVSTTSEDKEKRGLFGRKKSEEEPAAPAEDRDVRTTSSRNINVEFWTNPVNFKGYIYNGSLLKLYGVGPMESLAFKQYNGQLYLKRNGTYFPINVTPEGHKFVKLTDSTIIKELNK